MRNSNTLMAVFLFVIALNITAEAKTYKWVDDNGITQYGEIIPPEYANKERDLLKKSGVMEKRPEKVDQDAIRAKEEAEQQKKIYNQSIMEKQRRDSTLLDTYSNENEIDQARDRSMVLIKARIESHEMLLKSSQGTLDDHKNEVANRTKAGKKIPQSLTDDVTMTEARVLKYSDELKKSEAELAAVKTRFENEKTLYRRLKGVTPK